MEVGPILGILSLPRSNGSLFVSGQNESFSEILAVAQRMDCVAFVFSPFDMDWNRNAVWGYHFSSGEQWERHLFPMPSVIYNRIPNRTLENREDVKNLLAPLRQKYGSRFFNPCFLDKWKTHTILSGSKQTLPHLPETRRLEQANVIDKMLDRFGAVYLKPTANSLGNEIVKTWRTSKGTLRFIRQSLNQQRQEGVVKKSQDLLDQLPHTQGGGDYLVQQSVKLARCHGHPFDFRLLVQKNGSGQWCRTGLAVRVAGPESITTHVFYGGTRCPAGEALQEAARRYKFPPTKVKTQLQELACLIPRLVEKHYGSSFGELEMDLGIDEHGKVWFFEANSKPFRFDEKLIRAKSLVRLLHYVHHIDGIHKRNHLGPRALSG